MTEREKLEKIKATRYAIAEKRVEIAEKQSEIYGFEPDEDEAESAYVEMLDECYGKIKIGYLSWPASQVLEEMDPIAFRCGLSDFISNEVTECPERFEGYTELQEELSELQDELSDLESELEELEETEE